MVDGDFTIKANNPDYVIYKLGDWKNNYELNLVGISNEIPVTNVTCHHVLNNMEQIRKSEFEIEGETVNGLVALPRQLSLDLQKRPLNDLIAQEETEYNNILDEVNNLELLDDDEDIDLTGDEYLIYKLMVEKHSITTSKPANQYTLNHHMEELKKLDEKSNQLDNI